MKSKDEKKEEYKKLGIPEEQLDTILEGTYTVGEYINHQKRIFIKENVTAIMDNEFNSIAAICDILDAIYEGKLHNSELKSMKGDKIKRTAGHGINYYFDTKHGFDEMIANFATLSKSNNADEMLNLLKSIVGDEVYNMISDFYYQNIIQVNNEELNVNKGYGEQLTGGYSIQVEEVSESENAVFCKTRLIGPEKADAGSEPSYPCIVLKIRETEKPIEFLGFIIK